MSNCSTTTTTTCFPCDNTQDCDCPNGVVDAGCVQYTGEDLENFDINSGDFLDDILQELDQFTFAETDFEANSTDSIVGVTGGTNGHSPFYSVRIDPADSNAITVSSLGLLVDGDNIGDGKVKVDSSDTKAYLEDQLSLGTDGIITITPTTIGGLIYMVPSIDIRALLLYVKDHYKELLCELVQDCIPEVGDCTAYMMTNLGDSSASFSYLDCNGDITGPITLAAGESSEVFCSAQDSILGTNDTLHLATVADFECPIAEVTTTTTTTSTSTTSTTTAALTTFTVHNESDSINPFKIYLRDEVSSIYYVIDLTTLDGQTSTYTYNPLSATAELTIQHTLFQDFGIIVEIDDVEVYNSINNIGALSIPTLDTSGGTTMVLTIIGTVGGTTSTTTSTTTL